MEELPKRNPSLVRQIGKNVLDGPI